MSLADVRQNPFMPNSGGAEKIEIHRDPVPEPQGKRGPPGEYGLMFGSEGSQLLGDPPESIRETLQVPRAAAFHIPAASNPNQRR